MHFAISKLYLYLQNASNIKPIFMNQPKTITEGVHHRAIDLGLFSELMQYAFEHPKRNTVVQGKIFTGALLTSTGAEVSFQIVPPHTGHPFLHAHKKHEEIYVFLRGSGQFQVDGQLFDIKEGTVIRVSPEGSRSYRNNSDEPMVFMCIQTMAGSLDVFDVNDGYKSEGVLSWENS